MLVCVFTVELKLLALSWPPKILPLIAWGPHRHFGGGKRDPCDRCKQLPDSRGGESGQASQERREPREHLQAVARSDSKTEERSCKPMGEMEVSGHRKRCKKRPELLPLMRVRPLGCLSQQPVTATWKSSIYKERWRHQRAAIFMVHSLSQEPSCGVNKPKRKDLHLSFTQAHHLRVASL